MQVLVLACLLLYSAAKEQTALLTTTGGQTGPNIAKQLHGSIYPRIDPVQRLLQALHHGTKRRDLVIYNRVPKTASSTWQRYIDRLSGQHTFSARHFTAPPGIECPQQLDCIHSVTASPTLRQLQNLSSALQSECSTWGMGHDEPQRCLIDFHFSFLNFTSLGETQPIYINTVREPVARLISAYNYARYGARDSLLREKFLRQYGDLDLDQCMKLYEACNCTDDCTSITQQDLFYGFNAQMMFFCPWGSEACRRKDSAALAEALHTLAEYDAVGVLERMADSKALLEAVLPSYFGGLSTLQPIRAKAMGKKMRKKGGSGQLGQARSLLAEKHIVREAGVEQLPINWQLRKGQGVRGTRGKGKGGRVSVKARRVPAGPPSNMTMAALKHFCALDLAFYAATVQLLQARSAAAVASPAREALTTALLAL